MAKKTLTKTRAPQSKKPKSEVRKRQNMALVRMSDEEKQAWTAAAARRGMTVAGWLRFLAYEAIERTTPPK